MRDELKKLAKFGEFLRQYTLQLLRVRYRGSILGFLWTLLNPLIVCISFSLIFSYLNQAKIQTYGVFFLSGYLPWAFFLSATTASTFAILGNSNYITRMAIPRSIFPTSYVLVTLVDLLAGLVALSIIIAWAGAPVSPAILFLPVSILLTTLFAWGVCLLFAALNVIFRDFFYLWSAASFLWFFFTPILYPIAKIPEGPRRFFECNPFLPFVRLFQDPLSSGRIPEPWTIGLACIYTSLAVIIGGTYFVRKQRLFYLYL